MQLPINNPEIKIEFSMFSILLANCFYIIIVWQTFEKPLKNMLINVINIFYVRLYIFVS